MNHERYEREFFIALLLVTFGLMTFILLPVLNSIVIAVVLAILFRPVYVRIRRIFLGRAGLAAFATLIIAVSVIMVPLIFFGLRVFQEAQVLYGEIIPGSAVPIMSTAQAKFHSIVPWFNFDVTQSVKQILELVVNNLGQILSGSMNLVFVLLIALLGMFYFLKESTKIKHAVMRGSPLCEDHTQKIISKLLSMSSSIIGGTLLGAIVEGLCIGLGFFIFGLPNPVMWGSVTVIAALIPIVGISIVIWPTVIVIALAGNLIGAISFAVWGFTVMILMENFIKPYFVQSKTNAHPFLILLSVIGGLIVFGPTGFLLGPLILSLLLSLLDLYPVIISSQRQS